MASPAPPEETRNRMGSAVGISLLVPGAGHLLSRRTGWALFWFVLCEGLLIVGFLLAGSSQLDYGRWFELGGARILYLVVPEMGNVLGTQIAALLTRSVEVGGSYPEHLPWRGLGYLLSGASGVLSCFAAAHAAGTVLATKHPPAAVAERRRHPGTAAVATLLFPGAGHWLTNRRFKACLFGGVVLGMFFLGMALGSFADFDRQRHPYYWAGEMCTGAVGWITAFLCDARRFRAVLPYQDAGLLFITSAGLFNVIAALDAYHRAQTDWLGGEPCEKPEVPARQEREAEPRAAAASPARAADGAGIAPEKGTVK